MYFYPETASPVLAADTPDSGASSLLFARVPRSSHELELLLPYNIGKNPCHARFFSQKNRAVSPNVPRATLSRLRRHNTDQYSLGSRKKIRKLAERLSLKSQYLIGILQKRRPAPPRPPTDSPKPG